MLQKRLASAARRLFIQYLRITDPPGRLISLDGIVESGRPLPIVYEYTP